jgi:hypothetical protein
MVAGVRKRWRLRSGEGEEEILIWNRSDPLISSELDQVYDEHARKRLCDKINRLAPRLRPRADGRRGGARERGFTSRGGKEEEKEKMARGVGASL